MCVLYKNVFFFKKRKKKILIKKNGDEYSIIIVNYNYFIGYLDYFMIKFLK